MIMRITFECLRVTSITLQPFCPDISSKILDFLQVDKMQRDIKHAQINIDDLSIRTIDIKLEMKQEMFIKKIDDKPKVEEKKTDTKKKAKSK